MAEMRLLDCEEIENGYPEVGSKNHPKDGGLRCVAR